jgi:hypothetical protein
VRREKSILVSPNFFVLEPQSLYGPEVVRSSAISTNPVAYCSVGKRRQYRAFRRAAERMWAGAEARSNLHVDDPAAELFALNI